MESNRATKDRRFLAASLLAARKTKRNNDNLWKAQTTVNHYMIYLEQNHAKQKDRRLLTTGTYQYNPTRQATWKTSVQQKTPPCFDNQAQQEQRGPHRHQEGFKMGDAADANFQTVTLLADRRIKHNKLETRKV